MNPTTPRIVDPSTSFDDIPTVAATRNAIHQKRLQTLQTLDDIAKNRRGFLNNFLGSQLGLAIVVALLTFVLLCIVNPPLTQKKRKLPTVSENQDAGKALLFSFVAAVAVFFVPEIMLLLGWKKK